MDGDGRYTSGDWRVTEGSEESFVTRWTEFVSWTKANASGAIEFFLLRQADDPRHFISLGSWSDQAAIDTWRQSPEFGERLGRCRELCDAFQAHDFEPVAEVGD